MKARQVSRSRRWSAALAALATSAVLLAGAAFGAPAAVAVNYPSWDDVVAAKQNQAAVAAKVSEIKGYIADVQAELARLEQASAVANQEAADAEQQFLRADEKATALEAQAEASRVEAERTAEQAAALVSQMYRSGGVDRNMELFLGAEEGTADVLLERLAMMTKATERNTSLSEEAQVAQNAAESLGDQAKAARAERERLFADKEQKAEAAAAAVEQTRIEYQKNLDLQADLNEKLAALQDKTAKTAADYEAGVAYRAEQQRLAEIEAARKAAEEAANNPPQTGGGNGGGNSGGGGGGAWARPVGGWVSTNYWGYYGHTGPDLAVGYGTPIVAASSGTVTYAGYKDNYGGIMVHINHDGGVQTRYAHMSGVNVGNGQWVSVGQVIGWVGMTGNTSGPHLHYEVLVGGYVDPRAFMAQRGLYW